MPIKIEITIEAADASELQSYLGWLDKPGVTATVTLPAAGKPVEAETAKPAPKTTPAKKTTAKAPQEPAQGTPGDIDAEAEAEGDPIGGNGKDEEAATRDFVLLEVRKAFDGGKPKQVRKLLADHGGGAKSFSEVDGKLFAGIKKAIADGALA